MGVTDSLRIAAVQMDVQIGEIRHNLERVLGFLRDAARDGASLVVFPECALCGYCFSTIEEAQHYALASGNGRDLAEPLHVFHETCRESGITGIVGFLEQGPQGRVYNAAIVAGPDMSVPHVYRKTHLPTLGADRFVTAGDSLDVVEVLGMRVAPMICYDIRFPEAARVVTLRGADIIALPTNWPEGAESAPEYVLRARARENGVYIVAANRTGTERGRRFIGRSEIVAPDGFVLASAGDEETVLIADVHPQRSRTKRIVIEEGEWEQDTVGDRRPDLYGELAA